MTHLAPVESLRPKHSQSESVFLPPHSNVQQLPVYNEIEVASRTPIKHTVYEDVGTAWVDEWEMSDGTRRRVLHGEPAHAVTDIAVFKNTAWTTQVEGFNEDLARRFMELGFPVDVIGPEINTSLPLSRSAYDTHLILNEAERLGFHQPGTSFAESYSRGSMILFGVIAYSALFKRHVAFSDAKDPCIAHQLSLDVETIVDKAKDVPYELGTAAIQLGSLALHPKRAWHYRRSIDLSAQGIGQVIRTGIPLFSGDAGSFAHAAATTNPNMLLRFFSRSAANDQDEFTDAFKGCDNVTIINSGFGHLTGMDKRIIESTGDTFARISKQLRQGASVQEVDYFKTKKAA